MDSDDNQIEDTGDCRGGDMLDQEWGKYCDPKDNKWERARDRFANNDAERQAAKLKFFADNIDEDGEEWAEAFFKSEMGDFEQKWGDAQESEKENIWECIKKFSGTKKE